MDSPLSDLLKVVEDSMFDREKLRKHRLKAHVDSSSRVEISGHQLVKLAVLHLFYFIRI